MRYIKYFPLIILTLFSSCQKNEIENVDNLNQFGILGQWEIEQRITGGLLLAIACCDFISFKPDGEFDDLKGEFTAFGSEYITETNGVFELNMSNNIIHFDYNNSQKSYEFDISDNQMIFEYIEDSQKIFERWKKEE